MARQRRDRYDQQQRSKNVDMTAWPPQWPTTDSRLLVKCQTTFSHEGCLHETASSLVVAAAPFPDTRVARPRRLECTEIQPTKPYLPLHLQLHGEGYSLRGEASA